MMDFGQQWSLKNIWKNISKHNGSQKSNTMEVLKMMNIVGRHCFNAFQNILKFVEIMIPQFNSNQTQ